MSVILPGGTLGILGGGQLGRMTALAARALGYHVHAMDPDAHCAIRHVVERCYQGGFDDVETGVELARGVDVVTLEIEQLAPGVLDAIAEVRPLRPDAAVMAVIRDRAAQKRWLEVHGFPVGPFAVCDSAEALAVALARFGQRAHVKSATGGYDGRSQVRVEPTSPGTAEEVWRALGSRPCVAEQTLAFRSEVSVLVARRPGGQSVVYPPSLNHHVHGVLHTAVLPAPMDEALLGRAEALARAIAEQLRCVGVLAVELFQLPDDTLLVNELAPRPHNSFHGSAVACVTGQFEQHVRAVCDLPLGSVELHRPTAIVNLLGDLWQGGVSPAFDRALEVSGVGLYLYGKRVARPGRKMGHLSAIGRDALEALERAMLAFERLRAPA